MIRPCMKNEIERSIIPRFGGEFAVRIRDDGFSRWRYIGVYESRSEALDVFMREHQRLFGICSPFFSSHHEPHPAIIAGLRDISFKAFHGDDHERLDVRVFEND